MVNWRRGPPANHRVSGPIKESPANPNHPTQFFRNNSDKIRCRIRKQQFPAHITPTRVGVGHRPFWKREKRGWTWGHGKDQNPLSFLLIYSLPPYFKYPNSPSSFSTLNARFLDFNPRSSGSRDLRRIISSGSQHKLRDGDRTAENGGEPEIWRRVCDAEAPWTSDSGALRLPTGAEEEVAAWKDPVSIE